MEINWYTLSRQWFDFSFENPDKVNCSHTALYFYIIDKWNRFWQKEKFWLPSLFTMEALWIKSKNTYSKIFNDLVEFWFIKIIQKSVNQNSSTVISINSAISKNKSALDIALIQHLGQQEDSTVPIDKQVNKWTNNYIVDIEKIYNYWQLLKQKDTLWKTNRKLDNKIQTILIKIIKTYSKEDIEIWIKNYLKEIQTRRKDNEYSKHRFTLQEFFTNSKWFSKFYNLSN